MKNQITNLLSGAALALVTVASGCTSNNAGTGAPDMAAVKAKIQEKETAFAAATTAQNTEAIGAYYADDAVSMAEGKPALTSRAAIMQDFEEGYARRPKGSVTTFDVLDVYGSENQVTETGKTTIKDPDGKVIYTGKYMAVWEKRNGEYVCIRDISNGDAPPAPATEKSIHVFDMPDGLTEAQWSESIKEMNAVIAGIGYPGAGYAFYKTSDNTVKNNRYYFEGVWPAGDGYQKIHEDPAFIEASKKMDPLYAKVKAVEMYRRVGRVE